MLKDARISKKMSQKTLAKKLGITQPYISQLENRDKYTSKVTVDLVEKISDELEISLIDVFYYFCNRHKS